ncbi:MAG: tetratricopeptide repeat protein, partial [bacterium]
MSTEQAIQHLNTAKDLLKKPQPFNPDGYDPVKLAQFDYRDNFAWTFYGGDIDATITELNQALFHDTYLAEANALLANLYVIQKQFDKAINYYEEAMALNAADIISPLNQAATLDQSGKKDYAKRIYRSIKKDKRFPYPWLIDILLDNKQTAAEILEKQLRREAEPLWLSLGNRIKRLFQSGLSCILCGNSNLVPYYQNPKTNWQVVHCADCGFYFVSPVK